ncbi:MAG TPA: hypothetical protein VKA31_11205 [Mariprofundaceae bacterium]|nr:hypothetical protein [Mariprofundaceae bacterium]
MLQCNYYGRLWSVSALQLQRIEGLGSKLNESIYAEQHGAEMQLGIGILCLND